MKAERLAVDQGYRGGMGGWLKLSLEVNGDCEVATVFVCNKDSE